LQIAQSERRMLIAGVQSGQDDLGHILIVANWLAILDATCVSGSEASTIFHSHTLIHH
jgi:hypothetical protein